MEVVCVYSGPFLFMCSALISMYAQDYSKANFVIGGGPGFPLGDISLFADTGGHLMIGGGLNFNKARRGGHRVHVARFAY